MSNPLINLISRTQRNHGLEHATLHLLGEKYPSRKFAGHSDPAGFWILGEISTQEAADTSLAALSALQAGQNHLAVHPHCGTNLLVSGTLAGLAGAAALSFPSQDDDRWERIPLVITLATLALILSRPLGPLLQKRVTTRSDPQGMEIQKITLHRWNGHTLHRVHTRG